MPRLSRNANTIPVRHTSHYVVTVWRVSLCVSMVPSTALLLRRTHSLTELHLGHCSIGEDGACQLAEALSANSTLKNLWLYNNPLGERGAKALVESLAHNTSVKHLGLPKQHMISNSVVYGRVSNRVHQQCSVWQS